MIRSDARKAAKAIEIEDFEAWGRNWRQMPALPKFASMPGCTDPHILEPVAPYAASLLQAFLIDYPPRGFP